MIISKGGDFMFEFDKLSKRVLLYIKEHPDVDIEELINTFGSDTTVCIDFLLRKNYILKSKYTVCSSERIYLDYFTISAKGNSYLENKTKLVIFNIYPYVVSTISILLSIASFILSLISITNQ